MPEYLHQLLHGYEGGHRLLAASTTLPPLADQVAVELSDLSGSAIDPSLLPYLTGYPLPSTDYYALAFTWTADEMPRPGSVWTHTLLIPQAQVATARSFIQMLGLFVRPSLGHDLDSYKRPVPMPSVGDTAASGLADIAKAIRILASLYQQARPAIVPANTPDEFLYPVLHVWRQQWASLRQRFTFCTAAFAPRRLLDEDFWLQIVPERSLHNWPHADVQASLRDDSQLASTEPWLMEAAEDLAQLTDHVSQSALSANLPADRLLFRPFVQVLISAERRSDASVAEAVDLCVRYFPKPEEIASVKQRLVAPPFTTSDEAIAVATGLLRRQFLTSLDVSGDLLGRVATDLVERQSDVAMQLLNDSRSDGAFVAALVGAIAQSLPPADVMAVTKLQQQWAARILKTAPILRKESGWRQSHDVLARVVNLFGPDLGTIPGVLTALAPVVVERQDSSLVHMIYGHVGNRLPMAVADWLRVKQPSVVGEFAWGVLESDPAQVMERLARRPAQIKLIAEFLDRLSVDRLNLGPGIRALEALIRSLGDFPSDRRLVLNAEMFAAALETEDPVAAKIAVATFEPLHTAGMRDGLGGHPWSRLSPVVASIGMFWDWDRCERLRRALLDAFSERGWPLAELFNAKWQAPTVEAVRATLRERHYGTLRVKITRAYREGGFVGSRLIDS